VTQTDNKLIIDGLSNQDMGHNETTGELLARITNTMVIIKESYVAYENKVEAPPQDGRGGVGYLDATATQWKNEAVNNMMQFFKMQLFRAVLPGEKKAVAQHNQNTSMLDMSMWRPTLRGSQGPKPLDPWQLSKKIATLKPRMKKMKSPLFKTDGTTYSRIEQKGTSVQQSF
jgi:hypothetical protein